MLDTLLRDKEDRHARQDTPHVSHSRISRYLLCPEQYRLHYIERLRSRIPRASLVFGQVVHQSLAGLFLKQEDPLKHFKDTWGMLESVPLGYGEKDSWPRLSACGQSILEKFQAEELPKIGDVRAVERPFELSITGLDLPFVGVVDLVAGVNGKRTVADFKTAGAAYEPHEAAMSDQLTGYKLAVSEAEQLALCVLVKTKTPKIEWHVTDRTPGQLAEYLAKLGFVAHEIAIGRFFKRHGMWCSWCDFLPLCLGDRAKAADTLVQIA